jgi:hypothetical protein
MDEQIIQSEVEETQTEQVENTENTEPSKEKTFTQAELDSIIQKRLEREKVKYESDPKVKFIQDVAQRYNMTPDEYIEAVKQAEEQQKLNEMVQQKGIPEEVAQELMEAKKEREERKKKEADEALQKKQQQELKDFLDYKPDVKPADIPQSVWETVTKGIPLKFAYMEYENKMLQEKIGKAETNTRNAQSTTGSVTGNGQAEGAFFTREQVMKMSQAEAKKHYKSIIESSKRWKE